MNAKFVSRKKRIFLDKRGCMYFKMNNHQVQLPENIMKKKHILTRLLTSQVKIPDLRKDLKQTQQTRMEQKGDPKNEFNLAMIKFKPTSQLLLQKIRDELEGKTLPQIFEKLRNIKMEKQRTDQGVYINEVYKFLENKTDTQLQDEINNIKQKIRELQRENIDPRNVQQTLLIAKRIKKLRTEQILIKQKLRQQGALEKLADIQKRQQIENMKTALNAMNKKIGSKEFVAQGQEIVDNELLQKEELTSQIEKQQIQDEEIQQKPPAEQQMKPAPLSEEQTEQFIQEIRQEISNKEGQEESKNQWEQQKQPIKVTIKPSDKINIGKKQNRTRKERDDQISIILTDLNEEFIQERSADERIYQKAVNLKNPKTMRNISTIMKYLKDLDTKFGIIDQMSVQQQQKLSKDAAQYFDLRQQLFNLIEEDKQLEDKIFKGKGRSQTKGEGQSDVFLYSQMMKFLNSPKYHQYKDYFLGVFQLDDKRLDKLLAEKKNNKFLFWIQNTNNFDENEDKNGDYHWYANFVDLHHNTFNIFDSSGYLDENQEMQIKKYINILQPEYYMKIKTNSNDIQGSNSLCGFYSMLFLLRMMSSDLNFKHASMRDLSKIQGKRLMNSFFDIM